MQNKKNNTPLVVVLVIIGVIINLVVISTIFRACSADSPSTTEAATEAPQEESNNGNSDSQDSNNESSNSDESSGGDTKSDESSGGDTQSDDSSDDGAEDSAEWAAALEDSTEEDPHFKDLGDGRTAIQSHWRGVQIKYPSSYYAAEDDDALYVYDGDAMYVYARNITSAAEDHKSDLASFCASKAEDQAIRDFTKLFGAPTNTDGVNREGGDGKKRVCVITGNMWNNNADMHFKSKVFISGKNDNFLVMYTAFWRFEDKTGSEHFKKIKVTSWGKGDMYGQ